MNILYLPLDERPCNLVYPQMVTDRVQNATLCMPPKEILAQKKRPADIEAIWGWFEQTIAECDSAVISLEMLIYGGLLPSRLHIFRQETCVERVLRLQRIRKKYPHLKLYAFTLIMRTPSYSSSEEEPEYYAEFGAEIFQIGYLTNKKSREGLSEAETFRLAELTRSVPEPILQDYEERRRINLHVTEQVVELVNTGIIDLLAIPLDDCAPFGYSAEDQRQIMEHVRARRLQRKILLYPGADEAGSALVCRAYLDFHNKHPRVYALYSSTLGPTIIPNYEDRPIGESVTAHILAAGGVQVDSVEQADLILAVNSPGKIMMEAWDQNKKDVTYSSYRNLSHFCERLRRYIQEGKPCVVADVAFSNGGETELIRLLDEYEILDKLDAYCGWNTCCNTLGSVLSLGLSGLESAEHATKQRHLLAHLLEDWTYQAIVRQEIIADVLPALGASYYDFNGKDREIHAEIQARLMRTWKKNIRKTFGQVEFFIKNLHTPWKRMFEISFTMASEKGYVRECTMSS